MHNSNAWVFNQDGEQNAEIATVCTFRRLVQPLLERVQNVTFF